MTRPLPPQSISTLLSTLWIYILLSMLFRDVHEILRPGFVEELATAGTVRGDEVSSPTLVFAGFVLQLPLAMVVASRLLPPRMNRLANGMVAVVVAAGLLGTWPKDGDDLVFGAFQLMGLLAVIVLCLRWPFSGGHHRDVAAGADAEQLPAPLLAGRHQQLDGSA